MVKKLRIGIIGCGRIAVVKHFPAFAKAKDRVDLVAFCDIEIERAIEAAEKYGVPGAETYKDYRDLLKDKSIDVVYILTPNNSHSP
ncbi:Gfo/Idh/MocA family oxidoreductase, partial [Salmonella enterica]